jgi:hypothetical protein
VQIKPSQFQIRIQSQDSNLKIEVMFSVDRLPQSANFGNSLELNQTFLPKANLSLVTFLQVCKSTKIMKVRMYLFQGSKQS